MSTSELVFMNNVRRMLDMPSISSGSREKARYDRVEIVVRTLRMDRRPLYVRALEARAATTTRATVTPELVRDIRRRVSSGEKQRAIARALGISSTQIHRIVHGEQWAGVT